MSYSELNSHTPTDELKKDPTLKALSSQLPAIREAYDLLKQSQEISEKVKMSMEALVPALEVQLFGLNSELDQYKKNQEETENAYASVVRKLEDQLKSLRLDFEERELNFRRNSQEEISQLRKTLSHLNAELSKAIELTNIYQKLYHNLREQQKSQTKTPVPAPVERPRKNLNLFHVYDSGA